MAFDVSVSFAGTLGKENEKFAGDGYGMFSVSVSERVKKDNKFEYSRTYLDVKVFGKTLEYAKSLPKGCPVFVSGTLDQVRPYESKQDGLKASITIAANTFNRCPKDFGIEPSEAADVEDDEDDPMGEVPAAPIRRVVRPTSRVDA